MKYKLLQVLVLGLIAAPGTAAVYKCNTPDGVVFSQTPCAEDAEQVDIKSEPSGQSDPGSGAGVSTRVTDQGFGFAYTPEELLEKFGQPAARYTSDGTSHWFYPNGCKKAPGGNQCPEYLMQDGTVFQITWLDEQVMRKSVQAGRNLAGWTQPETVSAKRFTVADTGVVGVSKSTLVSRFGNPDTKRIFNGRELWEYRKVPMAPGNTETVTLYLEFEGNKVVSSVGN